MRPVPEGLLIAGLACLVGGVVMPFSTRVGIAVFAAGAALAAASRLRTWWVTRNDRPH